MKDIDSAKVIFLDSMEEHCLHPRIGSNCHFFDKFEAGGDSIQLRLDWGDLDANGWPTLDADFYHLETGKKRNLKGKRRDAHHTKATPNEGRSYEWTFEECNLKFKVLVVINASIVEAAHATDQSSAEVSKAKK